MRLTRSAKSTWFVLALGQIVLIASAVILFWALNPAPRPNIARDHLMQLNPMINAIKSQPIKKIKRILAKQNRPWLRLNVSRDPRYTKNIGQGLNPGRLLNTLKKHKLARLSLQLNDNAWLNLVLKRPVHGDQNRLIALGVLAILWLFLSLLLAYWAVKRLNTPLQLLSESLSQVNPQQTWVPLAITGDPEQRAVITQINTLQQRVYQLLNDRTFMLAAISHDLRTPLTRLKLRVENLNPDETTQKLSNDVLDMEHMLNDTLDFFQTSQADEPLQRVDLDALISALCDDLQDLGYAVQFKSDNTPVILKARMALLKRALNNLINNAIFYGKEASVTLKQTDTEITLTIDDRGPGIKESELEHATKAFHRGERSRSRQTGGTGLGLTIAKEIIQMHQGTLTLTNRPEGGLCVEINLPKA
jgi:signal transduction histidine kinase